MKSLRRTRKRVNFMAIIWNKGIRERCWNLLDQNIFGVGGGVLVQGARACVILVLRECILNAPTVSLVLPTFDDTGSLGSPRQVVYLRLNVSTLGGCLPFPCGE